MNKKELGEIKRLIKVDAEKVYFSKMALIYAHIGSENREIISLEVKDVDLMAEEDLQLYFNIMKKSLSGTLGKNLIEYSLGTAQLEGNEVQKILYAINSTGLKDENLLRRFAQKIVEDGGYTDSILITILRGEYQVPVKDKNDTEIAEEQYSFPFTIFAINQAEPTKIGLVFNREHKNVERKVNDEMEIKEAPLDAFLYPCFTGRQADVNHLLYHAKNAKSANLMLLQDVLQIQPDLFAPDQVDNYNQLVKTVFDKDLDTKKAEKLYDTLCEIVKENEHEDEIPQLSRQTVRDVFVQADANEDELKVFDANYDLIMQGGKLQAENLVDTKKITIKAGEANLSIKTDDRSRISWKEVDGRKCLVIELDDPVLVNGLEVHPK